ncbi:MAG: hypothetical protein K2J20_03210, partial [Bacilli bacterium]|nr:hypothetical protein [Bacilli bacterium]
NKGIMLDLDYFKDIPYVLNYFQSYYKEDIILFGKNKNIPNIKVKDKNVYYFENYQDCITDSLLKVNKYDV